MNKTNIEYLDYTWNPIVMRCTPVSEGCANCWHLARADMLAKNPKIDPEFRLIYERGHIYATPAISPFSKRKAYTIGVQLMGDLFHEKINDYTIDLVMAWIASTGTHRFLVLIKRPDRMAAYFNGISARADGAAERYEKRMREHFERYKMEFKEGYSLPSPPTPELRVIYDSAAVQESRPTSPDGTTLHCGFSGGEFHWRKWPLDNLAIGVTVENQDRADERLPHHLQVLSAGRWMSCEPLLGPIEILAYLGPDNINWVVIGPETGPKRRFCDSLWIYSLVRQCEAAEVPYFIKAFPMPGGRISKNMAEWPEWAQVRQYPEG